MTVRGGGIPRRPLALTPNGRMGPPLRSFAADAHDCIMVRVLGPTGYKVVARLNRAPKAGSPLIVIATALSVPSCSKPSRYGLARAKHAARLVRRPILTASARIDLSDARVGMKKRTLRSNQETDEGKRCAALANSLTKKAPYKGLGAESEEKREPVSDIDTAVVDSLKALDPDGRLEKRTSRACLNMSAQFGTGWPNLLLRDKLPTGNERGSAGMATIGSGAYSYEPVENWAKLPPGWSFKEIGGVGVDRDDNLFVFNRGEHPMIVFDREGNFLRSFGEGFFPRAHGVFMAPDDTVCLTDDGAHTVRQCTLEGKVLVTLGISGKPAPYMSGEPFHRCTHTAMSPQGDIYVSDGYGNSRVHKYAPNGKLLFSWGGPGTDPGEFNIAHNITCDADGWVYVADRENHPLQGVDGHGQYETQWDNLHRPCGLVLPPCQ